jgi:hypothetical protein
MGYHVFNNFIQERQLMSSTQTIPSLKNPRELSGVLVCDTLIPRDGIVGSNQERTASVQADGQLVTVVNK